MTEPQKSNRQVVLEAITELCARGQTASRASVKRMTGLKESIIDERIKDLKAQNMIRCDVPGFYEPVDQSPDRILSVTNLPLGRVKIELGDELLSLSPREADNLAESLAGRLLRYQGSAQAPKPAADTAQMFCVTKAAMVHLHRQHWPSIERDLSNAASNGLVRAKAGSRGWDEDTALAWARANKKLRQSIHGSR